MADVSMLHGRKVVVVGASDVAAAAIAVAFAEAGADVGLTTATDSPEEALLLKRLALRLSNMGRKSVAESFDLGDLAALQQALRRISTALGGPYSWANSANTYPPNNPQWVQADMGVDKTFRRVVVYTSQGYPIRDFDVQVWNGVTFVTVASVTGNTQLSVPVTFPARTSRLVRILGRSGPNHQLNYVRVNELEVYAV